MTDEELIKAVAQEVMGWKIERPDGPLAYYVSELGTPISMCHQWQPITNANHWIMVVERMRELGWNFTIQDMLQKKPNTYGCLFFNRIDQETSRYAHSAKIGHAICEAALKAVRHG